MGKIKNSEIEWIGDIPSSWQVKYIRECFKERREKVSDYKWKPLSVTKQGIVEQLETAAKSDAHDDRKKVCKGDFVINSRSDRKQSCGLSELDGSVSLINIVLENKGLKSEYIKYLLKNYGFAEEFYRWGSGIVADLWSTNYQKMKKIMIPVPSIEEQEKIGEFLDEKVLQIDKVIEKTQETIGDYKKYKQSIITKAVTKGLDENAKMKDSGFEFIGKIPSSWNICKVKNVCKIFGRIGFKGYTQNDFVNEGEGAITLSPSNFNNLKMDYRKCSYVSWNKYIESPEIQINNGDILFVKTGSSYGKVCLVEELPKEATINPQMIVLKEININNLYFTYLLSSIAIQYQTEISVTGGTIPTMSQEKIGNFYIVVPTEKEQKDICKYLKEKCKIIDELINRENQLIQELEEYKKSLIYEYVTGKKEVVSSKDTEMAELSLRILEQLPNNYSMCKIKLNKIQSVILKMIKYHREPDYEKHAAGPYSKEMMKDVYDTFEKEKWVKLSKDGMRDVYTLDDNYKEGIKRYQEHFKEYDNEITRIIKLFENKDTQESEIIATLFYCWNDFLLDGIQPTDDQIIEKFYAWSKRKKYIKATKVKKNLAYMRKNNLIPNGYGKKTIQRSNSYGRK